MNLPTMTSAISFSGIRARSCLIGLAAFALLGLTSGCTLRDSPATRAPVTSEPLHAEIPRGLLELIREDQDTCQLWMDDRSIRYTDGKIPACGNMGRANLLLIRNAPSALSITFQRDYQSGNCAAEGSPSDFRITLKTTRSFLTTSKLVLNKILQRASLEGDGVVVPGLRAIEVHRAPDVTPTYDYAKFIDCIMIKRSD